MIKVTLTLFIFIFNNLGDYKSANAGGAAKKQADQPQ
jgi:hypothetical protein